MRCRPRPPSPWHGAVGSGSVSPPVLFLRTFPPPGGAGLPTSRSRACASHPTSSRRRSSSPPQSGVEAACLLTVIEVETGGRPFEAADLDPSDGNEPALLFERHVFLKRLKALAPGLVDEAKRQGLTVSKWGGPGSAQYADQKTSAGRLALMAKAAALHAEAAYQSASFGLFQVMGFNYTACGFPSAVAMHAALTRGGVATHLAVGIAFMRSKGLLRKLGAHDWKAFASGYNGTAYKKNAYDAKLADAFARWTTVLRAAPVSPAAAADPTVLKLGDRGPRVRALQETINAFGIPLKADAAFGPATRRAVAAAQVELGQTGTGIADMTFVTAIEAAPAISRGACEVASKKEIKEASQPARIGDNIKVAGQVGLGTVATYQAYASTVTDTASQVQSSVDQARAAKETVTSIVGEGFMSTAGIWVVAHWQAIALAAACATAVYVGSQLVRCAVANYRAGRAA
ncbi:N-acetylmuramidase domain-containing protein [Methylobacterium sp. J-068]|uniref:N-acetylmuramidase domain-containing protein n=1 Tax=Methylobacterium sp. J-068 TaxID=2836649 RepID=UPI001FBBB697|nr:N-acetylmuramidase domain-containing protein [Methylobacterium sp. J-068]MCJ2035526.1 N-acetylmuramidase domain-containing protein [Methylobacterium sp. J-068]